MVDFDSIARDDAVFTDASSPPTARRGGGEVVIASDGKTDVADADARTPPRRLGGRPTDLPPQPPSVRHSELIPTFCD